MPEVFGRFGVPALEDCGHLCVGCCHRVESLLPVELLESFAQVHFEEGCRWPSFSLRFQALGKQARAPCTADAVLVCAGGVAELLLLSAAESAEAQASVGGGYQERPHVSSALSQSDQLS